MTQSNLDLTDQNRADAHNPDSVGPVTQIGQATRWDDVVNAEVGHIFLDEYDEGLRFIILRGPSSLCAYIGLPSDHPLSGKAYDDLVIDCHGGLTYSSLGGEERKVPEGFWWYGWDYAHCDDAATYDSKYAFERKGKKWTPEEVKKDSWNTLYDFRKLVKLAEQIHQGSGSPRPQSQSTATPSGEAQQSGQDLKQAGIKRVSGHNKEWMRKATEAFSSVHWNGNWFEKEFTGETIRFYLSPRIGEPTHPNAWGALISNLVKRGLIKHTGAYVTPKDKSSHARQIKQYVRA